MYLFKSVAYRLNESRVPPEFPRHAQHIAQHNEITITLVIFKSSRSIASRLQTTPSGVICGFYVAVSNVSIFNVDKLNNKTSLDMVRYDWAGICMGDLQRQWGP